MAYEKSKRAKVEILTRDKAGNVKTVRVQGGTETYKVIVRRDNNQLSAECLRESPLGYIPCAGNTHSFCYHSIAALRTAAKDATRILRLSEKGKGALQLMQRCGGRLLPLRSWQSGKVIWGLV